MSTIPQYQPAQVQVLPTVDMHHLSSAAVCCVGYSPQTQQMFVKFNASSFIYAYAGVTSQMWQNFCSTPSPGNWVAANLAGQPHKHPTTRLNLPYTKTAPHLNFVRPATPKFRLNLS